jgi:membrane-associated phospholipid phosphatase
MTPEVEVHDWFGDYPYHESLAWQRTTDALLYAAYAVPFAPQRVVEPWPDYGRDLAGNLGAVAVSSALTDLGKALTRRARPYEQAGQCAPDGDAYVCDLYGRERRISARAVFASFPSGHTSTVAASTVAWATTWTLAHPDQRELDVALYAGATGLTALTAIGRVEAGKHHPSDVVAGGLLGAACGVAVPWVVHEIAR